MKSLFSKCCRKDTEGSFFEAIDIFKQVSECTPKNVASVVNRCCSKLIQCIANYDYTDSSNLSHHLIFSLWSSMAILALTETETIIDNEENFEFEALKKRIEREHKRIVKVLIEKYTNNDIFLKDYIDFLTLSNIFENSQLFQYLVSFVPSDVIHIDELTLILAKIMIHEYFKLNLKVVFNLCDTISLMMLENVWTSSSHGSYLCIDFLVKGFESIYEHDEKTNFAVSEHLLKWIRFLIGRLMRPAHVAEVIDLLSVWLYFHSMTIQQVINFSSLIFSCCHLYHSVATHIFTNHFFQNIVLCMINSNEVSIVTTGYDIMISIVDRLGNKDSLLNPKLFTRGDVFRLIQPVRQSVDETLFASNEFVYLTDAIHKVVLNSIRRFLNNVIIARKVNTLISIIAIECCDSAQGLTTVISFALSIQQFMLELQSNATNLRNGYSSEYSPDPHISYYHGCVASWFSLISYVNKGDLDLFRNYILSVIELRADSAPYLLPSQENELLLKMYIYELDKSLYFDIETILEDIENSWVALTNNRDLLNSIKIPQSNFLIEKYVDLQLLDIFDLNKADERQDNLSDEQSLFEFQAEEKKLYLDAEHRYSEAFTEPFHRFIFSEESFTPTFKRMVN